MKNIYASVLLLILLIGPGCSDPELVIVPSDETPTELEGNWNGYEPFALPGIWSFTANGNLLTAYKTNSEDWYKSIFSLRADLNPKNITLKYVAASDTGCVSDTVLGIYKISGDSLVMAFGPPASGKRPADFSGSNNARVFISVRQHDNDTMGAPCPDNSSVYLAGRYYTTVQIGEQCWLKQNLNVGNTINENSNCNPDNNVVEKYCYHNDPASCLTYGGLYQWAEAMKNSSSERARGICPEGWHIPTYDEFQTLVSSVNGRAADLLAPTSLGGSNTSGFSALMSGIRNLDGHVESGGYTGYWLSSVSQNRQPYAIFIYYYGSSVVFSKDYSKDYGLSVRCLRNW